MSNSKMRQAAFSLAELVVSIGILVLMFTLAGQVFNMTITSTGQATALTEVSQLLRIFEQTLTEDLRHVQPGQSLILIQGNPVNAYWTQQGKEADDNKKDPSDGYNHPSDPAREDAAGQMVSPRADILMFFTARRGRSFVHDNVYSDLQQVVYGHAELGEYVLTGNTPPYNVANPPYTFQPGAVAFPVNTAANMYPSPTKPSPVPADQWHLARRSVLLSPTTPPAGANPPWAVAASSNNDAFGLANNRAIDGEIDIVGFFDYQALVLSPPPPLWLSPGPFFLPPIFNDGFFSGVPYDPATVPFRRSQLDPTPPALWANRLGHYFLPNCASFKVEWALDPHSAIVNRRLDGAGEVFWFDPGRFDPSNPNSEHPLRELEERSQVLESLPTEHPLRPLGDDLKNLLITVQPHPDGRQYSLAERFIGQAGESISSLEIGPYDEDAPETGGWPNLAPDGRPNLVVFGTARRSYVTGEVVGEDIFPRALRITIDLFDNRRRLDRPIRHVMVVPVGG